MCPDIYIYNSICIYLTLNSTNKIPTNYSFYFTIFIKELHPNFKLVLQLSDQVCNNNWREVLSPLFILDCDHILIA